MEALENGQNIYGSKQFSVPSAPVQPYIQDISYNEFKLTIPRFNEFTTGLKVIITDVYDGVDFTETFPWPNEQDDIFDIVVSKQINPATVYSVVAQYTTLVGLGPKSVSSRLFITAPSSPPENLAISDLTTNSFVVSWDRPAHIGTGIQEENLVYNVKLTGEDGYVEEKTTTDKTYKFENLVDATKYNIEAKAYLEEKNLGFKNETLDALIFVSVSQPAIIYQNSNPFAPKMIPSMPGEVTTSSVVLRWEPPRKLPNYDTLTYKVVYWQADSEDEEVEVSVEDDHYELTVTGLTMATLYIAKVKVETNLGQSEFSGVLRVTTLDDESEVGHFGDEIK
eukprot:TRINITY_DN2483_c0_g1_i1.p1 TRINITY_DN2483_c0_g1~~TRINITY_DN2483_c0_g1_i1.p1  ORF type:complete len:337 (-),score=59.45 TRINITY_DN2483_c0_g1_i1:51-1061(-)